MRVFITGATGFIGRNFVRRLLASNHSLEKVYLLSRRDPLVEDPRVEVLLGDLEKVEEFLPILNTCDYVFHIGGNATFGNKEDYDSVNYLPTKVMVDSLKQSESLKCFIYVSSIGAVDRGTKDACVGPIRWSQPRFPTSAYGRSKMQSEEYLESQKNFPFVIFRPTWVYGPGMRLGSHLFTFVSKIIHRQFLSRFGFSGRVGLVHVEDLCSAFLGVIGNAQVLGKTYIAVTENLTLGNIFAILHENIWGRIPRQIRIPKIPRQLARLHRFFPLQISCLFLDYLWAMDFRFTSDFDIKKSITLKESARELVESHPSFRHGYWVVTGANSGIGYALAQLLSARKERLLLIDKQTDRIESLEDKDRVHVIPCDLSSIAQIKELSIKIRPFPLFALINNAGIGFRGDVSEATLDQIEKMMQVNFLAPVALVKELLDVLIEDGSFIVNVASSIAYNPLPKMAFYSASKAALANWSESLSYELRKSNRVITFVPSGTHTNFQKSAGVRVIDGGKTLLTPEFVAERIYQSVFGKKPIVILGVKTRILLAISRLLPRGLNIQLWGKLFEVMR